MANKPTYEIDELQLLFGENCAISDCITIHQPAIIDIVRYGEKNYFSMASTLCAIPSDMKSSLWDVGIDWNKFSDFELFIMLSHNYTQEQTSILFGDLDFTKFKPAKYTPKGETDGVLVMYDDEHSYLITEEDYQKSVAYIRKMHGFVVKREKAGNTFTRDILIEEDRQNIARNKNKPYESYLKNLVSAMLAYPGFKYNKNELKECGIYEFMDTVQRSQIFTSTIALLNGLQVGMRDGKGIKADDLNWLRDIK